MTEKNTLHTSVEKVHTKKKFLLFHDAFLMKGGAERMNIEIAKILHADIATAVYMPDCYDADSMGYTGKIWQVYSTFRKGVYGFLCMKYAFYKSLLRIHTWQRYTGQKDIQKGDTHTAAYTDIFFSNEAISAIWNIPHTTRTYYYAHSISRHLFDLYDVYISKIPYILRPVYRVFAYVLKKIYIAELHRVETILVNSIKNKQRIRDWIGRDDAVVLYPPVDTQTFRPYTASDIVPVYATEDIPVAYKSYYISYARLTTPKRIDSIIRAFLSMPDIHLVVPYGIHDSQKDEYIALAGGAANIHFHILVDNENLPKIISGAICSIAVSREEDFGMVATESMCCGVPVVCIAEGGYRETVVHTQTGYMIGHDYVGSLPMSSEYIENALVHTLSTTPVHTWHDMQGACIRRGNEFSVEVFSQKLREIVEE